MIVSPHAARFASVAAVTTGHRERRAATAGPPGRAWRRDVRPARRRCLVAPAPALLAARHLTSTTASTAPWSLGLRDGDLPFRDSSRRRVRSTTRCSASPTSSASARSTARACSRSPRGSSPRSRPTRSHGTSPAAAAPPRRRARGDERLDPLRHRTAQRRRSGARAGARPRSHWRSRSRRRPTTRRAVLVGLAHGRGAVREAARRPGGDPGRRAAARSRRRGASDVVVAVGGRRRRRARAPRCRGASTGSGTSRSRYHQRLGAAPQLRRATRGPRCGRSPSATRSCSPWRWPSVVTALVGAVATRDTGSRLVTRRPRRSTGDRARPRAGARAVARRAGGVPRRRAGDVASARQSRSIAPLALLAVAAPGAVARARGARRGARCRGGSSNARADAVARATTARAGAVVDGLRELPDDAWVISDDPGFAWRAGRRVPGEFVDVSKKRFQQGALTARRRARRRDEPRRLRGGRVVASSVSAASAGSRADSTTLGYTVAARYPGPTDGCSTSGPAAEVAPSSGS